MAMLDSLAERIVSKQARIAVIGIGYVGFPLVCRLAQSGFAVTGIDNNPQHVETLNAGISPFNHIADSVAKATLETGSVFSGDVSSIGECDGVVLCVPTPLDHHQQPDLSFVVQSLEAALPFLHNGMLISLESTTWPGTTEEVLQPMIENAGFTVGQDIALVYSPEREDPGNADYPLHKIPKVIGGVTDACLTVGNALYGTIVERIVPVSSTRTAEMTKLLENIQRSVNIGLMNEMKVIANRMGINIFEVIDAASTKPFGFTRYTPGPGLGGHCIPIDPFYLTWKAREYEIHTRFIELAGEINSAMPHYVVSELINALSTRAQKAISGTKILLIGMAYKKNVNDMRESPALKIWDILTNHGAHVAYYDPHIPVIPKTRQYAHLQGNRTINPRTDPLDYDAAIIVTDHDNVDYDTIVAAVPLCMDTRCVSLHRAELYHKVIPC